MNCTLCKQSPLLSFTSVVQELVPRVARAQGGPQQLRRGLHVAEVLVPGPGLHVAHQLRHLARPPAEAGVAALLVHGGQQPRHGHGQVQHGGAGGGGHLQLAALRLASTQLPSCSAACSIMQN